MRIVRFERQGVTGYGRLEGKAIVPLRDRPWERVMTVGEAVPLEEVRLLAPSEPSKIVAVGRNYRAHAAELGNEVPAWPIIFLKPPTAVIGPEEAIVYPSASKNVHHEAELAVVIGRRCRHVHPEDVPSYVWGYTCANDVTARDLQRLDEQWTRSKSFDTFCPLGPWIDTELNPADASVVCRVNGLVRQSGRTGDMVFGVSALVAFISEVMTLEPGDVILTGTPEGVGPLARGDVVEVEIEGVGVLRNRVV
ncbi:MAG: fumarylacetoacetate hydrolase family protein [Anaerolineae bacterium]|nr:fumarylacetoacetate hydrolase family protein [Anaerolineae bacterium]